MGLMFSSCCTGIQEAKVQSETGLLSLRSEQGEVRWVIMMAEGMITFTIMQCGLNSLFCFLN
jgi:hypothetical protein